MSAAITAHNKRVYHRHHYGKSKPWAMRSDPAPTGREYTIARALLAGSTQRQACLAAGYRATTARCRAYNITARPGIKAAIRELAQPNIEALPAVGPYSESEMREAFNEVIINDPNVSTAQLVELTRGVCQIIIATAEREERSQHRLRRNQPPQLTPEQQAALAQKCAELQRTEQSAPVPTPAADTPVNTLSAASPQEPPAIASPAPNNELLAIMEAQERERRQREIRERQQRGDVHWWKRRA